MLTRCLRTVAAAILTIVSVGQPLVAADDGPRLPCGVAPVPAYAEPGTAPTVRAWTGETARAWRPPTCTGWTAGDADMLVALAGSFRFEGEIDGLLARVGAISAQKGIRYWSTTEKRWQALVTDAVALSGPDVASRRPDFTPAELTTGRNVHFAQSDNRSAGRTVYRERVLVAGPDQFVVTSENVTPVKKMMVTLFEPGGVRTFYQIVRRGPGVWNFYSLTRTRMASSLLPTGGEASYINRAAAFFRHVAGIPTDQEPPAAR